VGLADALEAALAAGTRRVEAWIRAQGLAEVAFADEGGDPFANVNTPEEVSAARARLG
jgi:molybdopterin-guanine dinucleotide biosynthesis protein A